MDIYLDFFFDEAGPPFPGKSQKECDTTLTPSDDDVDDDVDEVELQPLVVED